MQRFLCLALLAFVFSMATTQSCSAIVWFTAVKRGEIPGFVRHEGLRKVLLAVPPIGGTSVEGSWNNCTLYFRGTQKNLEELLDKLHGLQEIYCHAVIDPSGNAGRVESKENRPLPGTLIYQYSITVSGEPYSDAFGNKHHVSVVIHKSGGIDPAKLRLPKDTKSLTLPMPDTKTESDVTAPTKDSTPSALPTRQKQ